MLNNPNGFKSNGCVIAQNYLDVDTEQVYDLLIYQCSINNLDRSFVIGSIENKIDDISRITKYISEIILFRLNNNGEHFISAKLHEISKNQAFNSINFTNETYNLLFKEQSYEEFKEKFIFKAKETIIDTVTKRFSTLHTTKEPFNSIVFYNDLDEHMERAKQKSLKAVI